MNFAQKLIRNYEIIKDQDIDKKINLLSNKITDKIKKNKIFMAGNGGSAAQAQHFSTELIVRYNKKYKNRSYPCISLCADNVLLTACANDYGYDQIFAKQLEGLSKSGDILIPDVKWKEPLSLEIDHFLDCIKFNKKCITGTDHAKKVVEILELGS